MADSKAKQEAICNSESYKTLAAGLSKLIPKIVELECSTDIDMIKIILKFLEAIVDNFAAVDNYQKNKNKKEEPITEPVIEPLLENIKVEKEDPEETSYTEIDPNIALDFLESNVVPTTAEQNIAPRDPRTVHSPAKTSTVDYYKKTTSQTNPQNNTYRPNNGNYKQYQTKNKMESAYDNRRTPYPRNPQYAHRVPQPHFHHYNENYSQYAQYHQPDIYNMQQYQMQGMQYMNQQVPPSRYFPQ